MKAVTYAAFGGPEVLTISDVPEPHVGPDTLVVRVKAVGLNPVDYKIREGYLEGLIDTHLPAVPAWDVAGVVEQVGLDTPEFAVGDEVLAYARKDVVQGGTLAELVAVPVRTLAHKPAGVSFEEAAALPLAGLTALATVRRSGLGEGSTVLVHAAAGGVGSFATQLAVRAGARVVGTASEGNHEYLRSLGAEPVEYGDGLVEAAKAIAPEGFDAIIDLVGGDALDTVPELLRDGGTVVSITDARARDEFGGQYVWVRPSADDLAELVGLVESGDLTVEVAETFELERATDAFRLLEEGHVRGKVVVTV
ncbi:alcohol dehydrogenase [Aeromicrobium sp. Root495]|uniref:NADP-dependent oxidoreductase n=1 Tax=Aeromicrobium sp. Root495 TaxID=1736550 RepID=UPI0006FA23F9|nr:NADP-dependent oxidoreductase [Aeromicrobium sp. Root495]KQY60183.1 alcohol dehydrogenase [Aeromicrobium sp. Root495]